MSTAARKDLVLTCFFARNGLAAPPPEIVAAGFHQQLAFGLLRSGLGGRALVEGANRLIAVGDQSYFLRQLETVRQISDIILSLPLPAQYQNAGRYYRALCLRREGDVGEATRLLEQVSDRGAPGYRSRAMLALGSISLRSGDSESALSFYAETCRLGRKTPTVLGPVHAQLMINTVRGLDGDHRGALRELEQLGPLVKWVGTRFPAFWYDYLNSLAVELMEVGRTEEAASISGITLATPYAAAYPEWHETARDIDSRQRSASRSFVSLQRNTSTQLTLLSLPAGAPSYATPALGSRARILSYQEWKEKMSSERPAAPTPEVEQERGEAVSKELTSRQMLLRIIELISTPGITRDKLRRMLAAVETIAAEPVENTVGPQTSDGADETGP